jgi:hypothetical protein
VSLFHPPSNETKTRSRGQKLLMGTDGIASPCNPKPVGHERLQMAASRHRSPVVLIDRSVAKAAVGGWAATFETERLTPAGTGGGW